MALFPGKLLAALVVAVLKLCALSGFAQAQVNAPAITAPNPGTQLDGTSVLFQWSANGAAVNEWYFRVGLTPSATDFANARLRNPGMLQYQVNGLPSTGVPVYVEFSYKEAGRWTKQIFEYQSFAGDGSVNQPPVAVNDAIGPLNAGQSVSISVLSNDNDPDGGIDPASVVITSAPASGVAIVLGDGRISYTHDGTADTGTDTLSYTVRDDDGDVSNVASVTIAPIVDPDTGPQQPTITSPLPGTELPGTDVTFNWSPGSVAVRQWYFRAGLSPGTTEFANIRFRKASTRQYRVTGLPANGVPVFVEFSYLDSSRWVRRIFQYQAFNGNTTVNQPPVAANDTAGPIDAGQSLSINVLSNDSDVDGTVDPASVVIVSAPISGAATVLADGRLSYTHNGTAGTGTDTLSYTVRDDDGDVSNVASVTIAPIVDPDSPPQNSPPVAVNDTAGPLILGQSITVNVLANDTDPDGQLNPDSVTVMRQPVAGNAVVRPGGTIEYTHTGATALETESLTYTVRDTQGATSNAATLTISPIVEPDPGNAAPLALDDTAGPVTIGRSLTIDVLRNDSDSDGTIDVSTVSVVASPGAGTVIIEPNGQITYTHDGTAGTVQDVFTYTVQDDDGDLSNEANVILRPFEEPDGGTGPTVNDPVQGPGLGNLSYASDEVFTQVSVPLIDGSTGILPPDYPGAKKYGVNVATMLNGYMLGIFAPDSGAGPGGWIAMDVSNPRNINLVHRVYEPDSNEATRSGDSMRTAEFREPHSIGLSRGNLAAIQSGRGIEIWDWSDVLNPVQRSTLALPGASFGDYGNVVWQLFWQAPYLYVARSERGIDIVNTSDIDSPFLEASIPTSELGGFSVGAIFALGNELYISSMQTTAGFSILDISNPTAPQLVRSVREIPRFYYSSCWDGRYAYFMTRSATQQKHVYDTRTTPITLVNDSFTGFESKYCNLQDNKVIFGNQNDISVMDASDPQNINLIGSGSLDTASDDVDHGQAFPFGNLVWVGNDHGTGSGLIAQSAAPDNSPAQVVRTMPASGELNLPVSSRIGVFLSDSVLMESVNETTFRVTQAGSNEPLSGRYSVNLGFVNFSPESQLQDNQTYEVRLEGIQDYAGNSMAAYTFWFSTGENVRHTPGLQVNSQRSVTGATSSFIASAEPLIGGTVEYSWNFGDGNSTPFATSGTANHVYTEPGHYTAVVTVREGTILTTRSVELTIFNPLTPQAPTRSVTITNDGTSVFAVNEDNGTVSAISASAPFNKQWEVVVGDMPRAIARDNRDRLWVTSQGSATVSILNTAGQILSQINVGRGTQPFGVAITPDGATALVTLQATGEVVLIDTGSLTVTNRISVGQSARAITIESDSQTAYVTRFISPQSNAEVISVDLTDGSAESISLEKDTTTVDGSDRARGIFNYLSGISMAPDGQTVWVATNKANVDRGVFRDNQNLTFETTIRAATTQISTLLHTELSDHRMDINNRAQPKDIEFSRLGDYVYIAIEGQNAIDIRDSYDHSRAGELMNTGRAPRGLTKVGNRLFVHNFMSRTIAVYDVSRYEDGQGGNPQQLASIPIVATESLHPRVLAGKQIFYNAQDPRMTKDGYISCASCHADAGGDNRVWDFTGRGEGLRNTPALNGRMGIDLGNVHWTANFDEIHDFENDIRSEFGGLGFLSDAQFAITSDPLGAPKTGLSVDLDNLAFYLGSLNKFPLSPARDSSGNLTSHAIQGRQVFLSNGCADCHRGEFYTDQLRHDVGTVQASSGQGIGQSLSGIGFKTPTLIGLFESAPYFHNGQARTLEDVLQTGEPHTVSSSADRAVLVEYLLQIEYEGPERLQPEIP